jgi:hypothetical protein
VVPALANAACTLRGDTPVSAASINELSATRLEPVGDGHYQAQSGALSMAGDWDLKVIVRLAGRDDVQAETQLTATDPGAARNQPGVPPHQAVPKGRQR